jgi:hypothetical protein
MFDRRAKCGQENTAVCIQSELLQHTDACPKPPVLPVDKYPSCYPVIMISELLFVPLLNGSLL